MRGASGKALGIRLLIPKSPSGLTLRSQTALKPGIARCSPLLFGGKRAENQVFRQSDSTALKMIAGYHLKANML
jgi:hypothetical protein